MSETHPNLMASNVVVHLPEDPAVAAIAEHGRDRFLDVVAAHPTSSLVWALLAETCLAEDDLGSAVAAYAYARTGYHRGLDALRRAGWRGVGEVPLTHEPNAGFLRALAALARAARAIGEDDEAERCTAFVHDCGVDPAALDALPGA